MIFDFEGFEWLSGQDPLKFVKKAAWPRSHDPQFLGR